MSNYIPKTILQRLYRIIFIALILSTATGCPVLYSIPVMPAINGVVLSDNGPEPDITIHVCTNGINGTFECIGNSQTITDKNGSFNTNNRYQTKIVNNIGGTMYARFQVTLKKNNESLGTFSFVFRGIYPKDINMRCYLSEELGNKCRLYYTAEVKITRTWLTDNYLLAEGRNGNHHYTIYNFWIKTTIPNSPHGDHEKFLRMTEDKKKANEFVSKLLLNKIATFEHMFCDTRFLCGKIYVDGKDIAIYLLENGIAEVNTGDRNKKEQQLMQADEIRLYRAAEMAAK